MLSYKIDEGGMKVSFSMSHVMQPSKILMVILRKNHRESDEPQRFLWLLAQKICIASVVYNRMGFYHFVRTRTIKKEKKKFNQQPHKQNYNYVQPKGIEK